MLLVHKLKLVPIAGYLRSAAYYDAAVLIAMIATLDAIQKIALRISLYPPFFVRMAYPSRQVLERPAVVGVCSLPWHLSLQPSSGRRSARLSSLR